MSIQARRAGMGMPALPQRMPVEQLGRWLMRSGIRLPVPLNIMDVSNLAFDPDDLVEVTTPRIKGSATPDQLERLSPPSAALLADVEDILRHPDVVAYVSRGGRYLAPTVYGGLIRGGRALLLAESQGEMVLQPLAAPDLAEAIAAHLPNVRPASLHRTVVARSAVPTLATLTSVREPEAQRLARAQRLDLDTLHQLIRLQLATNATGIVAAVRAGRPMTDHEALLAADWAETPSGAILTTSVDHDFICIEGATRAAVTRAVARAVTGSMTN